MGARSDPFINQRRAASKAIVNYTYAVLGYTKHGMKLKRAVRLYAEHKGVEIVGCVRQWLLEQYLKDKKGFMSECRVPSKPKKIKRVILTKEEKLSNRKIYNKYLKSSKWRSFRKKIIEDRNYQCQRCRNKFGTKSLQIHHITYQQIFNETPEDVLLLCKGCHKKEHGR